MPVKISLLSFLTQIEIMQQYNFGFAAEVEPSRWGSDH